jgi:hypothetical protein
MDGNASARRRAGRPPTDVVAERALADPDSSVSVSVVAGFRTLSAASRDKQLVASAQRNEANTVRCLLKAGANVETRWGPSDATVLCLAAESGCERVVKVLLQAGARVCAATSAASGSLTALHQGAEAGSAEVLRLLLDAGAAVNAVAGPHRITPLVLAAFW